MLKNSSPNSATTGRKEFSDLSDSLPKENGWRAPWAMGHTEDQIQATLREMAPEFFG